MSQKKQILQCLKAGGSLTPNEALRRFGCFRLAARILDLREAGHPIESTIVEVVRSDGTKGRVARYFMASGSAAHG